jgi:hypothetical protein
MQFSCSNSVQNQIGNFRLCVQVLLETYCIKCDVSQHVIRELNHLFAVRSAPSKGPSLLSLELPEVDRLLCQWSVKFWKKGTIILEVAVTVIYIIIIHYILDY